MAEVAVFINSKTAKPQNVKVKGNPVLRGSFSFLPPLSSLAGWAKLRSSAGAPVMKRQKCFPLTRPNFCRAALRRSRKPFLLQKNREKYSLNKI